MTTVSDSRLPQVPIEEIHDARLIAVLERAKRLSTPKPAWYLTLAHSPEMAVAYAQYWDTTHRDGQVEHTTKSFQTWGVSSAPMGLPQLAQVSSTPRVLPAPHSISARIGWSR